jgi:hypothetical protein
MRGIWAQVIKWIKKRNHTRGTLNHVELEGTIGDVVKGRIYETNGR